MSAEQTTADSPRRRLEGKVAIVTGAGTLDDGWGNGKAASVAFAREGAKVIAADRRLDAAESTAALITGEGGECVAVGADVTSEEDVEGLVQRAIAEFGRIDVLQNNVGVGLPTSTTEVSLRDWNLVHKINLTGTFLTTRAVLPGMAAQGSGSIVNVSSIASMRWTGVPFLSYSTSKAAVNQLTRSVALEYARLGIRCNAVVPGFIDTPTVYAGLTDERGATALRNERNATCPTGAMGDAWDVAYASLFLASDEAKYVNGHLLVVDGGLSLQVSDPTT